MLLTYRRLITVIGFFFLMGCGLPDNNQLSESTPSQPVTIASPNFCDNLARFINPDEQPKPQETELDRYFRLAFNEEVEGNFQKSLTYYQKAFDLATCDCDQKHALAGKKAVEETQVLVNRYGIESKPTQYFWGRLQELTQNLPCVQIQQ